MSYDPLDEEFVLVQREEKSENVHVRVANNCIKLKDISISALQIRQRYNSDIKYFVIKKENCTSQELLDYVLNLIKNNIKSDLYTYI